MKPTQNCVLRGMQQMLTLVSVFQSVVFLLRMGLAYAVYVHVMSHDVKKLCRFRVHDAEETRHVDSILTPLPSLCAALLSRVGMSSNGTGSPPGDDTPSNAPAADLDKTKAAPLLAIPVSQVRYGACCSGCLRTKR